MSDILPVFFEPWRFTRQDRDYAGSFGLTEMPRLAAALVGMDGEAEYALRFYCDERRRLQIRGRVRANVVLVCQRCLAEFVYPLSCEIALAVVRGLDEVELLPEDVEPLLLAEDERRRCSEIVEDELLLALPQIARHPDDACGRSEEQTLAQPTDEAAASVDATTDHRENPFAVLAGLKKG